jgi:hypothetical protein
VEATLEGHTDGVSGQYVLKMLMVRSWQVEVEVQIKP